MHTSCSTCSSSSDCAWCSSTSKCLPTFDTYADQSCVGVIFSPPCPKTSVDTTIITGDLLIKGNETDNIGGNLHLFGPCTNDGCRSSGYHSLRADGNGMAVEAGGPIILESADSNEDFGRGSDIFLHAGSGVNALGGGEGGDVLILAGDARGAGAGKTRLLPIDFYYVSLLIGIGIILHALLNCF